LHEARRELHRDQRALPVWDGELYLELHRGTFTSQAWIKRQNRFAESALRDVEALASSIPHWGDRQRDAIRTRLDALWKLVLLNQFHDILPGSSIAEVYEDARRDHIHVAEEVAEVRSEVLDLIASRCDTRDCERPVLVRNPASTDRGGVVEIDGTLIAVDAVPAMGCSLIDLSAPAPATPPVHLTKLPHGVFMQNAWLEATISAMGWVSDLRLHGTERSANARDERGGRRALNELWLYDDHPRRWEAWDLDRDYTERGAPVQTTPTIDVVTHHPLRVEVRVQRALGRSSQIEQIYRLDAGSKRLDVRTFVHWQEERTLLRALFPIDVRTRHATFGTQFGAIERPTHRNTSWEEARFEVPGHAWMDLSEPGFGLAVLDDGKYGRSAVGDVLGLSLLRSPHFPDARADRGEHAFVYALMPHDGDWRADGIDAEAEALREPLRLFALRRAQRGTLRGSIAPWRIEVDQHCGLHIAAWKPAESGRGRILRCVETRGGRGNVRIRWAERVAKVRAVDVLERPLSPDRAPCVAHSAGRQETIVSLAPFQIVTLLVTER
jgi:alpha-mannosidase